MNDDLEYLANPFSSYGDDDTDCTDANGEMREIEGD